MKIGGNEQGMRKEVVDRKMCVDIGYQERCRWMVG